MAEWTSLIITIPEDCALHAPAQGDQAHRLAAKAAEAGTTNPRMRVESALFHHDESGGEVNSLSPIRFSSGHNTLRVTAVGDEAVDLLERNGHALNRALGSMAGKSLQERWIRGRVDLAITHRLHPYRIRHLVVTRLPLRKIPHGDAIRDGILTSGLKDWLSSRIRDGIDRQLQLLGMSPLDDEAFLTVTKVSGFNGWVRGTGFYGIVAHEVEFSSNVRLSGPWAAGHLCLLGSGYIDRARTPLVAPGTRALR